MVDLAEMTRTIRGMILSGGYDLYGVASPESFEDAPKEFHPKNSMPNFRAVISLASAWRNFTRYDGKERLQKTILMLKTLEKIYEFLTSKGYKCRTIDGGAVSLPRIAERAGLGEVGMVNILVTEEYGLKVGLGAIITDAPLIPDEKNTKDICIRCEQCVKVCPATPEPFKFDGTKCNSCGQCVRVCPVGT